MLKLVPSVSLEEKIEAITKLFPDFSEACRYVKMRHATGRHTIDYDFEGGYIKQVFSNYIMLAFGKRFRNHIEFCAEDFEAVIHRAYLHFVINNQGV